MQFPQVQLLAIFGLGLTTGSLATPMPEPQGSGIGVLGPITPVGCKVVTTVLDGLCILANFAGCEEAVQNVQNVCDFKTPTVCVPSAAPPISQAGALGALPILGPLTPTACKVVTSVVNGLCVVANFDGCEEAVQNVQNVCDSKIPTICSAVRPA